ILNDASNISRKYNTLQGGEGKKPPPLSCCANVPEGDSLDTLAQLGKRARAKYVLQPLLLALVDQAKADKDGADMEASYWSSYHCASQIKQSGQKLTSEYCNQRWCLVCSRIRTAKAINKYKPHLEQMTEAQFVTLTDRTVTAEYLPTRLLEFKLAINQIVSVMKKRGTPLIGIRKIECTYNAKENRYHPHFHFLIDGEYEANVLVAEWLKRRSTASEKAQNIKTADEDTLVELFKYTAKHCSKGQKVMNAPALHTIYKALRGVRTFQTLGGFGMGEIEKEGEELKLTSRPYLELKPQKTYWNWKVCDWHNVDNETPLTGYKPSAVIQEFSNSIETKLCNVTNATNNSPPNIIDKSSVLIDAVNERLSEEITMMITEEIPY
ncbi:MAG: protein rep, partial [Methylophilaceae bacterium]